MMDLPPPIPLDLSWIAPPATLEALSPAALGSILRLVRHAWGSTPPCTLPDDDGVLARLAGTTLDLWCALRPEILTIADAADGRLVFRRAIRTYQLAHARRERRSAASGKANQARWGSAPSEGGADPPPNRIRFGSEADPKRIPAPIPPPHPPSSSGALAPKRPKERISLCAPPESARSSAEMQLSSPSDRARAWLDEQLDAWEERCVVDMIGEAVGRWSSLRRVGGRGGTLPRPKILEIARAAYATPARVAHLIATADGYLMDEAKAMAEGRPAPFHPPTNPVAVLISGLCLSMKALEQGRPPALVPRGLDAEWEARRESERHRLAVVARIRAMRDANQQHTNTEQHT